VTCASLWLDPADALCPAAFRKKAVMLMREWAERHLNLLTSPESLNRFVQIQKNPEKLNDNVFLRQVLLDFIADFANWDNSTVKEYLNTSRELTQAAHEALGGVAGTRPLVVDPFCGGGSIPLEALRVGAAAFASDLNPIPVLLNKVILEYIPKYGRHLVAEVRKWGDWIKEEMEKELAELYPQDSDGATPIAYIWARTIQCEGPGCGAEVPLIKSLWLAKKGKRSIAIELLVNPKNKDIGIEIVNNMKASHIGTGTTSGGAATCPICGYTTPVESVRIQMRAQQGGSKKARLIVVITTKADTSGRVYRSPNEMDHVAAKKADNKLDLLCSSHVNVSSYIPDEPINHLRGFFNVVLYGMTTWGDLFSARQALTLVLLCDLIKKVPSKITEGLPPELIKAVQVCMALSLGKQADRNSAVCRWINQNEAIGYTFGRQALPMNWDFVEMSPIKSSGAWNGIIKDTIEVLESQDIDGYAGTVVQSSATDLPLPDDSAQMLFTDPPYYSAIPYADLSDFFYVWLKRVLCNILPDLFKDPLSPKDQECVALSHRAAMYRNKDSQWFESEMGKACDRAQTIVKNDGIGCFVFANKETAGWEAMLKAIIENGWIVTASWPIDTERPGRLRAQNSAALASSIHIVCRPRRNPDGSIRTDDIGDWREVLSELPLRIHDWMPRLAEEGVVGADAIFACLGPALEIFSRYSRVEKISGEVVTLKEYLGEVWAAVAKEALNMIFSGADATGFEEDARLTAMWLWTLKTGDGNGDDPEENESVEDEGTAGKAKPLTGFSLEYDAARKIAQGLGAHLEALHHLVEVHGDTATLIPVAARTRYLFGKDTMEAPKSRAKKKDAQMTFDFGEELKQIEKEPGPWSGELKGATGRTILDQLHQSMIFFAANRSEALRRFLVEEGVGNKSLFWRLAQALSALYPTGTDEKRWVDGVLARKKSFGF
jgi:adenine-specific DNA methylase